MFSENCIYHQTKAGIELFVIMNLILIFKMMKAPGYSDKAKAIDNLGESPDSDV